MQTYQKQVINQKIQQLFTKNYLILNLKTDDKINKQIKTQKSKKTPTKNIENMKTAQSHRQHKILVTHSQQQITSTNGQDLFQPQNSENPHTKNFTSQQQILIKNIDSGSYQVFNFQEVDCILQSKPSTQTRLSLWNSYFDQVSKTDVKLLKLVMGNDVFQLKRILSQQPIQLNTFRYIDGWTLLHHAVVKGQVQVVKLLIEYKIDVNLITNQMKRTALHEAVLGNKLQIVKILIENNADPNIQDTDGNTPLHYAAQMSYQQIFQSLLNSQISLNMKLKNSQQMTVIDCIRDEKIFKKVQSRIQQNTNQNQNQLSDIKNRRFIKSQDGHMIKRFSKADIIEKFLFLNENLNFSSKGSLIVQQKVDQMKESVESTSSSERKKKVYRLGKKPSHWIEKRGQLIASQSIYLMKQSIIEPEQSDISGFEQSLENYEILRFIGSGGFAEVFLARRKKSSKLYAIKRISKSKILQKNLKRYVYSQRNIMIKCTHPFIVEAHSMFQDHTYLYIAMQYCQCGDLLKAVIDKGVFTENQAKIYAAQVGLALEYMHSNKILFRDLKTANVLISKDGYVKVSDFGLAKESTVSFTFLGSVQYLAPEMVVDTQMKQHTKSIDWYLFGVLIYELLTGRPPFYSENQQTFFKKIKEEKPSFPSTLSRQCKNLLSRLLQKDPNKRLGSAKDFEQIKSHQWFKQVDFEKILSKSQELNKFETVIKEGDLRKKIPIDNYVTMQTFEHFKSWNYIKRA